MEKPLRSTRSSRKHRIGRASARLVIDAVDPGLYQAPDTGEVEMTWMGGDERGRELEIMAIEKPDCILVIHVMPTHYRKGRT